MHRSKLPLTAWFWAAHLMTTHSNGMSARQLEDQLGVTYKTACCGSRMIIIETFLRGQKPSASRRTVSGHF